MAGRVAVQPEAPPPRGNVTATARGAQWDSEEDDDGTAWQPGDEACELSTAATPEERCLAVLSFAGANATTSAVLRFAALLKEKPDKKDKPYHRNLKSDEVTNSNAEYFGDEDCKTIKRKLRKLRRVKRRCNRQEHKTCWKFWEDILPIYLKWYKNAQKEKCSGSTGPRAG